MGRPQLVSALMFFRRGIQDRRYHQGRHQCRASLTDADVRMVVAAIREGLEALDRSPKTSEGVLVRSQARLWFHRRPSEAQHAFQSLEALCDMVDLDVGYVRRRTMAWRANRGHHDPI